MWVIILESLCEWIWLSLYQCECGRECKYPRQSEVNMHLSVSVSIDVGLNVSVCVVFGFSFIMSVSLPVLVSVLA